jgi:hypothetical protein
MTERMTIIDRVHRESFVSYTKGKHRLRVFENRVLKRISGPKREEVVGGWRRLHNDFHNL